jgi:hypothetical protein
MIMNISFFPGQNKLSGITVLPILTSLLWENVSQLTSSRLTSLNHLRRNFVGNCNVDER